MRKKVAFHFIVAFAAAAFCLLWFLRAPASKTRQQVVADATPSANDASVDKSDTSLPADTFADGEVSLDSQTKRPSNLTSKKSSELQIVDMSQAELVALNLRDSEAYMRHMQSIQQSHEGSQIRRIATPEVRKAQAQVQVTERLVKQLNISSPSAPN